MKFNKILVLAVLLGPIINFAMEKPSAEFSWLPSEIKQEVVNKIIDSSSSLDEAIAELKKLRLVNKKLQELVASRETIFALQKRFKVSGAEIEQKMREISPTLAAGAKQLFYLKLLMQLQQIPFLKIQDIPVSQLIESVSYAKFPDSDHFLIFGRLGNYIVIAKVDSQGNLDESFGKTYTKKMIPFYFSRANIFGNIIVEPGIIILSTNRSEDINSPFYFNFQDNKVIISSAVYELTLSKEGRLLNINYFH